MSFAVMTVSDSCRGEGRATAPLKLERAIINARMVSRTKIRTVFVLFPMSQGKCLTFVPLTIGVERMVLKKDFSVRVLKKNAQLFAFLGCQIINSAMCFFLWAKTDTVCSLYPCLKSW